MRGLSGDINNEKYLKALRGSLCTVFSVAAPLGISSYRKFLVFLASPPGFDIVIIMRLLRRQQQVLKRIP